MSWPRVLDTQRGINHAIEEHLALQRAFSDIVKRNPLLKSPLKDGEWDGNSQTDRSLPQNRFQSELTIGPPLMSVIPSTVPTV